MLEVGTVVASPVSKPAMAASVATPAEALGFLPSLPDFPPPPFGGGSFFGNGTMSAHGNWAQGARSNQLRGARGAGGTSGYQRSYQGANGMKGCVVVMEFI